MATGAVQCLLPTIPGHRYQLSYNLRGPCAVGWWNGSVEPLSQRAQDLISGNHGAFFNGATNTVAAYHGDIGASSARTGSSSTGRPSPRRRWTRTSGRRIWMIRQQDRAGRPAATPIHQRLHDRRLDQAAAAYQRNLLRHRADLLPRLPRALRLPWPGRSLLAGPRAGAGWQLAPPGTPLPHRRRPYQHPGRGRPDHQQPHHARRRLQ